MERKNYCILACGGHGSRMGGETPKQFLRLGEKTILQHTVEGMLQAVPDLTLIVVLPREWMEFWRKECVQRHIDVRQRLVEGGISRFHSVRNALQYVPDGAVVAVHDGVRPLASRQFLSGMFEMVRDVPAVIPVVPVVDTLKTLSPSEDGQLRPIKGASADRSVLYGAQTPQLFHSELLKAAYAQPFNDRFTDDDSVLRAWKEDVEILYVPGERYNIKITTPEDLALARLFSTAGRF